MFLYVNEIIGPTIQGEGPQTGRIAWFIRLMGCDSKCSWCDTDSRKGRKMELCDIVNRIPDDSYVVITGGNPCLHECEGLTKLLHWKGCTIGVETQGTIYQPWLEDCEDVILSPKPPSAGNTVSAEEKRALKHILARIPRAVLKVCVLNDDDLEFALNLHREFPGYEFIYQVVTVPGDTIDSLMERYRELIIKVKMLGDIDARILPQIHYLLWGGERGR